MDEKGRRERTKVIGRDENFIHDLVALPKFATSKHR
jgi:hypothetical protein